MTRVEPVNLSNYLEYVNELRVRILAGMIRGINMIASPCTTAVTSIIPRLNDSTMIDSGARYNHCCTRNVGRRLSDEVQSI